MSSQKTPPNRYSQPYTDKPPSTTFLVLSSALIGTLLMLGLSGCSQTETLSKRIDQSDDRTAVQTQEPDTIRVDSLRVDTVWSAGATITWPETVEVAKETPTEKDTAGTFPLQEIAIDSAHVRLAGPSKAYTIPHPCFGERLLGRSVGGGVSFRVTGECVPRDTVVKYETEERSWVQQKIDGAARSFSLLALLVGGLYAAWGIIGTAAKAALPW